MVGIQGYKADGDGLGDWGERRGRDNGDGPSYGGYIFERPLGR